MKKSKKTFKGIAILSAIAAFFSGCKFLPSNNEAPCIYGGPDMEIHNNSDIEDPGFDPSLNYEAEVYGPPEWFENNSSSSEEDFEPEGNIEDCIYGGPDMLGEDNN